MSSSETPLVVIPGLTRNLSKGGCRLGGRHDSLNLMTNEQ
jgi:hypothetical protein